MCDIPPFRRDLVLDDPVFHLWAAYPRPAFARREDDIHLVGDLRCEVIDVGVKIAVIGRREEQLRVVVQEHESHVMDSADQVRVIEATITQTQQSAQPRGPAWCEWANQGEFRDFTLTESGPTGAFHPRSWLRRK